MKIIDGAAAKATQTAAPTDDTRWLSADEQRVWRCYLQATALFDDLLDRHLQKAAGMPHLYYGLLVLLSEAPRRRLRMTELAIEAKISRSRITHAIARLEKSGFVRRESCSSDGRGQFAVLTHEGQTVLGRTAPGHAATLRQALFDRLTEQQLQSLGDIMRLIAAGLEPNEAGADLPWRR
ncbi:MarR family winged helix-turn-helix transcriptional regulator [Streptomyces sp. NPDC001530]|uniref:MarR family winged helix-turn-helix transcriptional regulator n=1 Tax=Streptomyces sp. NPDC001530 TaxID=3364582 RepID=UPI00368F191F